MKALALVLMIVLLCSCDVYEPETETIERYLIPVSKSYCLLENAEHKPYIAVLEGENTFSEYMVFDEKETSTINNLDDWNLFQTRHWLFLVSKKTHGFTNTIGIVDLENRDFKWVSLNNIKQINGENCFVEDNEGEIYFSTSAGIVRYDIASDQYQVISKGINIRYSYIGFQDNMLFYYDMEDKVYTISIDDGSIKSVRLDTNTDFLCIGDNALQITSNFIHESFVIFNLHDQSLSTVSTQMITDYESKGFNVIRQIFKGNWLCTVMQSEDNEIVYCYMNVMDGREYGGLAIISNAINNQVVVIKDMEEYRLLNVANENYLKEQQRKGA